MFNVSAADKDRSSNTRASLIHRSSLVPPEVSSPIDKSYYSVSDTVTLHCLIDANPEPDIRWMHRFSDDINQEVDLSRQFHQGSYTNNNQRRENGVWFIKQEQLNATRWKTVLFIKVNA